jgi:hypothetical protein
LNQVWGLEGCPHFYPLRKNRSVRFDFSVATVLSGWRGQEVSFNTTVGGGAYSALLSPDLLKPEIKQELIIMGAVTRRAGGRTGQVPRPATGAQ